ncbi:Cdc37 N terminal kinase binding-domain-containing protein [Talaromyces proteolyticus]|uniref:Hsp90 chaperone protein kinase-targeting subunit n=1 Tax=Talaromyces proteolyticus TaxID=1131652 RepID=A0AAD4L252_9EURO|nr:Cdc37 N terminal kinase binding-domain-containing protein [Talaromyces proteolyticus]KAH8704160.1 Cdc37 N terminal kinase binding-domain-containing protein [Talaromyces proteolyticus]
MVLDYSKWDALELSDDSDIEVHPNVDKRSFIRAKQNQIHQQRLQRRHEIETLKYERIINDGLLERIDKLLGALRQHEGSTREPEELVFQSLIESAGDPAADQPPAPPEGVHVHIKEQPKYSQMMGSLVDQVKKEVEDDKSGNRLQAYITGVHGHKDKVLGLQQELLKKLAELEKEETSKITSNDIHTGFDSSFVTKPATSEKAKASTAGQAKVELLNPSSAAKDTSIAQSSGTDADVEDEDEEADIKVSDLAKQFAKIPIADYKSSLQFISTHPEVVAESETDGLLVEAFNSQMDGNAEYARQCVHHGLLLQYCRSLGRDGVALFFKRITTKDHQAGTLFRNDVNETYNKIKTRAAELAKNRSPENDPAGVEQIQLHAVDPNTKINISIPPADSTNPEEIEARNIFDSFPPGLQRALQSESLDEVNKVLGKMSVDEAEVIVDKLGQGGMLSLEEGIVDATTEEGRKKLEEIEREGKRQEVIEEIGEPAEDQLD